MKILIVDDEKVSRRVLLRQLEGVAECTAVDDSQKGLELIIGAIRSQTPYDLVTMDVSMPKIDGQQLLKMLRQKEQQMGISRAERTKVIMVSSRMNLSTIRECIRLGCDGYLSKPVQKYQLISGLSRLGITDLPQSDASDSGEYTAIVGEVIKRFYSGNIQMPVLPDAVSEIKAALTRKQVSIQDLSEIIARDLLITSKLISVANSALYRGVEKVTSLNTALLRMGIKAASGLMASLVVMELFKSDNTILNARLKKLWTHSFACACFARRIGQELGVEDTETLFLMGMTHDIGKMLLTKAICDLNPKEAFNEEMQVAIHEIHTTFGAALLKKMRFGRPFVQIAEFHHWRDFSKTDDRELMIISLADELADKTGFCFFNPEMAGGGRENSEMMNLGANRAVHYLGIDMVTLYDMAEEMKIKIESGQSVL